MLRRRRQVVKKKTKPPILAALGRGADDGGVYDPGAIGGHTGCLQRIQRVFEHSEHAEALSPAFRALSAHRSSSCPPQLPQGFARRWDEARSAGRRRRFPEQGALAPSLSKRSKRRLRCSRHCNFTIRSARLPHPLSRHGLKRHRDFPPAVEWNCPWVTQLSDVIGAGAARICRHGRQQPDHAQHKTHDPGEGVSGRPLPLADQKGGPSMPPRRDKHRVTQRANLLFIH